MKDYNTKYMTIALTLTFFVLGWFTNSILNTIQFHQEKPFLGDQERASPYDRIKDEHLELNKDFLKINFKNLHIAYYSNTNSMDPVLDEDSFGIEWIPESEKDIHIGDIVAYKAGDFLIVHRVVDIKKDKEGWYALLKGDNSRSDAKEKVRFNQIRYVVLGVLY